MVKLPINSIKEIKGDQNKHGKQNGYLSKLLKRHGMECLHKFSAL